MSQWTITCPHVGCGEKIEVEASVYGRRQFVVEDLEAPDACPESGERYTDKDYENIRYAVGDAASNAYYEMKAEDRS